MDQYMEYWNLAVRIWETVDTVIAAAAMIAAFTPTPKDDTVLKYVRQVINLIGMNFGFAKNKE